MICYLIIGVLYVLGYCVSLMAVHGAFKITDGEYAPRTLAVAMSLFWPITAVIVIVFMLLAWLYKTEEVSTS